LNALWKEEEGEKWMPSIADEAIGKPEGRFSSRDMV
jgi:hypothetical protein